jgi:hypothetical protein
MRVLICGGRNFDERKRMRDYLFSFHEKTPITAVIHGGASGADRLGGEWARHNGIAEVRVDANWTRYGKRAGPVRNGWMIQHCFPELVIAFPGGYGTRNMIEQATAVGIPVIDLMSKVENAA